MITKAVARWWRGRELICWGEIWLEWGIMYEGTIATWWKCPFPVNEGHTTFPWWTGLKPLLGMWVVLVGFMQGGDSPITVFGHNWQAMYMIVVTSSCALTLHGGRHIQRLVYQAGPLAFTFHILNCTCGNASSYLPCGPAWHGCMHHACHGSYEIHHAIISLQQALDSMTLRKCCDNMKAL